MAAQPFEFPRLTRCRQENREGGTVSRLAANADGATMAAHDSQGCGQAQSPAQELGGKERLENASAGLGIHTRTGVRHVDSDIVTRGDGAPFGTGPLATLGEMVDPNPYSKGSRLVADSFAPVDDQVHDQLLQLSPVGLHWGAFL